MEAFWAGFLRFDQDKLAWRSPIHRAFVEQRAQVQLMQRPLRIFVSYSSADNAYCRVCVAALRGHGLDVWYDEDELEKGDVRQVIEEGLAPCEPFVVIFSAAALQSAWVNAEIDAALSLLRKGQLKTFLPVIAAKCDVPLLLSGYKRIDGPGSSPVSAEQAVSRILGALGIPVRSST